MFVNLKVEFLKKGIRRKELAQRLNISEPALSNKLNGKNDFTLKEVLIIKQALQVDMPIEELFARSDVYA